MEIIFDPHLFDEKMVCFYAPVSWKGEIVGVLRRFICVRPGARSLRTQAI